MNADNFIIALTQTQMNLLKYALILCQVIFILSAGIVIGSLLLALIFRISAFLRERHDYSEFANLLVKDIPGKPLFWILCLLIPYAVITFILLQFYHEIDFNFLQVMSLGALLVVISFPFFLLHITIGGKDFNDLRAFIPGCIAFAFLLGAIFLYSATFALFLDPEKWLFSEHLHKAVLTWNGFTRFLGTLFLLLSVTGAWLVFKSSRKRYNLAFAYNLSPILFLLAIIPQPLLILWNAILIPYQSITQNNLIIFAVVFLLLATAASSGVEILKTGNFASASRVVFIILTVILLLSINDLMARERALEGQVLSLRPLMEKVKVVEEVKTEKKLLQKGEEVFTRFCSGCHSFDTPVVGPALRDVVPGYRDIEELKAFIKNPVKKNPDFPQMPPLGLSDEEIDAVAGYLMESMKR